MSERKFITGKVLGTFQEYSIIEFKIKTGSIDRGAIREVVREIQKVCIKRELIKGSDIMIEISNYIEEDININGETIKELIPKGILPLN